MTTSNTVVKPLYVYLQRPDSGAWVTVGRYLEGTSAGDPARFRYAQSYIDAKLPWAIDPVNLPLLGVVYFVTSDRYGGLPDVLRDASPDSWGQMLLRRQHGLPQNCPPVRYLALSGNGDRWGALAIGASRTPSIAHLASPRMHQIDALVQELLAISENRPAINSKLRNHLFATPSLGGARPKATVQDGDVFWLAKPGLPTDVVDQAALEHVTQKWGSISGLQFAETMHRPLLGERSVVMVKRFDRQGDRRIMAISAASLLQIEYPPVHSSDTANASYPRLAEELRRIGAPPEDWKELFGRMVFNALVGNDDDHPRNHAAIYSIESKGWRLAPAFDVVPNPDETPRRLAMQVCAGQNEITREGMVKEFNRFGFQSTQEAEDHLDALLERVQLGFDEITPLLSASLQEMLRSRLEHNCALLAEGKHRARQKPR